MIGRFVLGAVLCVAGVDDGEEPVRLGSTAWRHGGSVTGVAFVDGGERVITTSLDGTWAVRDADSGAAIEVIGDDSRPVLGLSAGDDGAWIAFTIRDGVDEVGDPRISTAVYDYRPEVHVLIEPLHVDGYAVLSRDGRRLAARVPGERRMRVLDVASRADIAALDVGLDGDEAPWWFALSADGATLIAGGRRATSRADVSTWLDVHPVDGGEPTRHVFDGAPAAFALTADGHRAGVVLADGTLHVVGSGDDVVSRDLGEAGITALAFVDDARVLTRSGDGIRMRAFDEQGASAVLWAAPSPMPVLDFAVDLPGGRVAPIGRSSDVMLLSLTDGRRLDAPLRHPGRVTALGVAPAGDVVVTGGWTGEVMAWDAATGRHLATVDTGAGVIAGLGFLAGAGLVAAAGRDGAFVVLDRDLAVVARSDVAGPTLAMAVAPDGRRVATGHRDGLVHVHTLRDDGTSIDVASLQLDHRHVTSLAWSPDGARLAVVATSLLHVVDVASTDVVHSHDPRCPIADVAWAGPHVALGLATRTARVLDAATFEEVFATPRLRSRVETVELSDDGGRLAVSAMGGAEVRVFDVTGDAETFVLDDGGEDVSILAWRAGLLVAGSSDGTARVWRP